MFDVVFINSTINVITHILKWIPTYSFSRFSNLQLKELYSNSKSKATSNCQDSFYGTKHSFFKSDNQLETRDMVQTARMIKDTYGIHQSDVMKELKFVLVCVLFNLFLFL